MLNRWWDHEKRVKLLEIQLHVFAIIDMRTLYLCFDALSEDLLPWCASAGSLQCIHVELYLYYCKYQNCVTIDLVIS